MEAKERHGCVTAWLIFMIVANSFTALSYLFMGDTISQYSAIPLPQSMMQGLAIHGIANLVFSIILFQWKKWAFWGFAGTSLFTLFLNLYMGLGIGTSLFGLLGIGILYAILQIKKDGITAWEQLD